MPTITRITEFQNKELINLLDDWLQLAKKGELTGIAYAVRFNNFHHGMGIAGTYVYDPAAASAVIGHLKNAVDKRAKDIGVVKIVED